MHGRTKRLHFHFSLSCTGEGNGKPLQCSCLENPRDWGTWWVSPWGRAESDTTEVTYQQKQQQNSRTCAYYQLSIGWMNKCNVRAMRNMFFGLTVNKLAVLKMLVSCECCQYEFTFQMIKQRNEACPKEPLPWEYPSQLPSVSVSTSFSNPGLTVCRFFQVIMPRHGLSGNCVN